MKNLISYIDKLQNGKICDYLSLNHWHEISPLFDGKVRQFITPDEDEAILVPIDKNFVDFYRVMFDSLKLISKIEKTSIKALLNKLINPTADILKWRIADDDTSLGNIPFSSMSNNIEYIRDLLSATCSDILSPSVFHAKVSTKDVQEQLSKYKFGQTEIGSYIMNIICPLGYYQYQLFEPDVDKLPLSRQININLIDNINKIQQSIEDKSSKIKDEVAEGKISVNFLNSLVNIYEENKDSQFTISADWNPSVPNPSCVVRSSVELHHRYIDKVAEIAEEFTPSEPEDVEKTFFGKITNIAGEAEVENRDEISVIVAAIGDEKKCIKVKTMLNFSQYYEVVEEAFQRGADVKITGTLKSLKRQTILTSAKIEIVS